MTIEPHVGGRWYEKGKGDASGLWGTVQTIMAPELLEIVGALFPQWGGPATMHLSLKLEAVGDPTRLTIHDTLFGAISDTCSKQHEEGWNLLFSDGLKAFVEATAPCK